LSDDGKDTAHVIGENDVAVFDGGYHPTAAAPGVTIAYLWVLSGEDKAYNITIDPRFAWVPTAEAVLREMKS
jgi:5-deoxy-glucuronate isomerase